MKIIIIAAVFTLLGISQSFAQPKKELSIGDMLPDIEIKNVINYPTSSIKLADFKGKLLIFDFWATWCSPCVAAFPHMDSLNKKFPNKVIILPVSDEKAEVVTPFLNKMNAINHLLPISIVEDGILKKLFPHSALPHFVWIDETGKVIAITEEKHVTENNIRLVLGGKSINAPIKKEKRPSIINSLAEPLFSVGAKTRIGADTIFTSVPASDIIIHSTFNKYNDEIAVGGGFKAIDSTTASFWNISIWTLYKFALYRGGWEVLSSSNTTMRLNIKDTGLCQRITSPAVGLEYDAFIKENGYCYEIKVPPTLASQKYEIMLDELNRYFGSIYGIEGVIEKQNTKYLGLTRINGSNNLSESKSEKYEFKQDAFSLKMMRGTLGTLIAQLRQPLQFEPYIEDETGYTGKYDFDLNCKISDLKSLNVELSRYGLQLQEKEKFRDIAIIRMKRK